MSKKTISHGPKGHFLLGNLPEFRTAPIQSMQRWHHEYGDLLTFRLGPRRLHLISGPELAEEALVRRSEDFIKIYDPNRPLGLNLILGQGLLTADGKHWRRQRQLMQPMFGRRSVSRLSDAMTAAAGDTLKQWQALPDGTRIDVAAQMMRLTLEIITRTMFSTTVLTNLEALDSAFKTLLGYVFRNMQNPLMPPLWIPTAENRAFKAALTILDRQVVEIIERRRQSGEMHHDLLGTLLQARDPQTGAAMDDRQLRDEVVTIFTAGHETTANALSWTWHLLDRHPEVAANLRNELQTVLAGRKPGSKDYGALEYTRAVFREALRLYPPAPMLIRRASRDMRFEHTAMRRGDFVVVSVYNIHRHPDYWEAPERFDPTRFLPTLQNAKHRSAYLPFGLGQRSCIGNHFAVMEGVMALATLAPHFRLRSETAAVEAELAVTLKPRGGLPMRLERIRSQ